MSETKAPETVVSQQPTGQQQPTTLSKLQAQTGTEEWHHVIFNCFEGPDNLCEFSRRKITPCYFYLCTRRPQGNLLLVLRLRQTSTPHARPNVDRLQPLQR